MPVMLNRGRTPPSVRPSLVIPMSKATSLMRGSSSIAPSTDQEPQDRKYARLPASMGRPWTAQAESWAPPRTTVRVSRPGTVHGPTTVRSADSSPNQPRGMPRRVKTSSLKSPPPGVSRPDVEAIVRDHPTTPVSR